MLTIVNDKFCIVICDIYVTHRVVWVKIAGLNLHQTIERNFMSSLYNKFTLQSLQTDILLHNTYKEMHVFYFEKSLLNYTTLSIDESGWFVLDGNFLYLNCTLIVSYCTNLYNYTRTKYFNESGLVTARWTIWENT